MFRYYKQKSAVCREVTRRYNKKSNYLYSRIFLEKRVPNFTILGYNNKNKVRLGGKSKLREESLFISEKTMTIWNDFSKRFRNSNSINVYFGDINEFLDYCRKDFIEITQIDADKHYEYLQSKVKRKELRLTTVKKKIKELHKFSDFIVENRETYKIRKEFDNFFYRYAVQYFSDEELQNVPTLEEIDKIMEAAKDNIMLYTILAMVERMGLKSTDICRLKLEDIVSDPNGVYAIVNREKEKQIYYIPEDVVQILELYLEQRKNVDYLFYNKWGKPLNVQYLHTKTKELTKKAKVPRYSLKDLRKVCGVVLFAYGARPEQVAKQMGITSIHIRRYDNEIYNKNLLKEINDLVHLKIVPPKEK